MPPTLRCALALAALSATSSAPAAVIYDTITNATFTTAHHRVGEYPAFAGETVPHNFSVATRITIAGDGYWRLDAIGCRISRDGDYLGAGRARMWIGESIDGGSPVPSTALGTIATTSTTAVNAAVEGLSSLNVVLQGGHSYWVMLGAVPDDPDGTRLRWYRSSLGAGASTFVDDLVTPEGWGVAEGTAGGLKIAATAIPAPGALAVLAAGIGLAGRARRREVAPRLRSEPGRPTSRRLPI